MKSLLELWNVVLNDLGQRCGAEGTARDFSTVSKRAEQEGVSFLTMTLPAFGKDFERALEIGEITPALFPGMSRLPKHSVSCGCKAHKEWNWDVVTIWARPIPRFLSGFMERVFCPATGILLDEPDIESVFAIRQLTLMYAKILLPCSDARRRAAFGKYIECEQEVKAFDARVSSGDLEEFEKTSTFLWGNVLTQVDEDVYYGRIIPKHGPGATADRLRGNAKWDQIEWTERLEHIFPFMENVLANGDRYNSSLDRVNFLEPGAERPVRVVDVPKTLKTPRLIAIEPTCMQYMQQGLWSKFHEYLESPRVGKHESLNMGYGFVNFTSQEFNHQLAWEGSSSGQFATLDLSEASDRVSNQLVRTMLQKWPWLAEAVDACRSRSADVEGHGVIRLAKFASMGSALTFPIEAMVFTTVVVMGIARELKIPVSPSLLRDIGGRVLVYGDDIIVPVDFAQPVMEALESFGFKVNSSKSFWRGNFRESCGAEYFLGESCSITRIRREIPTSLADAEECVSLVSSRNQFYMAGLWNTAKYLDEKISGLFGGHYPIVEDTSPVLGRLSVSFGYQAERMCEHLHAPLVRGYVVKVKKPKSRLDGLGALAKCLIQGGNSQPIPDSWDVFHGMPSRDPEHLQYSGRPDAVSIKLRFASPY